MLPILSISEVTIMADLEGKKDSFEEAKEDNKIAQTPQNETSFVNAEQTPAKETPAQEIPAKEIPAQETPAQGSAASAGVEIPPKTENAGTYYTAPQYNNGAQGGYYQAYNNQAYNNQAQGAGMMQNPYLSYDAWKAQNNIGTKKKKKPVWLFVLLGILGTLLLIALIGAAAGSGSTNAPNVSGDYVAVLYIDSEIAGDYVTTSMYGSYSTYNQVFLIDTVNSLINDEKNRGIMLYINSPGGEVTATDEFSQIIKRYKNETGRPVYAYFGDYAASGAYWIGCHADKIIAHKYCTTGSIGVTYGTHYDISGMLEQMGIKATELTAGENKAMGSMNQPLTDEQKAIYQAQLDEIYMSFVNVVAENRGLTVSEVKKFADGRTFLASKALDYKLIDAIGYYGQAQSMMIEDCGFSDDIIFYDCINKSYNSNGIYVSLEADKNNKNASLTEEEILALVEKLQNNRRYMAKLEY